MEVHPRDNQRGIVLVLALIVLVLVSVIVADATHIARIEYEATRNADLDLKIEYALRGGYQIAEAYLREDLNEGDVDSLQDSWAIPEGIEWQLDPESAGQADSWDTGWDDGSGAQQQKIVPKLKIWIEDEERKWPLNILTKGNEATQKRRLEGLVNVLEEFRAGTNMRFGFSEARDTAERIRDFMKRQEGDGGFGPTPRPNSKTGGLLSVKDLALHPAISPSWIYDQIDDEQGENPAIAPGLMHFLTPWTDLRININTASKAVLRGLFRSTGDDKSVADDIYAHREDRTQELMEEHEENLRDLEDGEEDPGVGAVFQSIDELPQAVPTVIPRIYNESQTMMTVNSSVFSIWVEAEVSGIKSTRRWVVRREGARFVIILCERVDYPRYRDVRNVEDEFSTESW